MFRFLLGPKWIVSHVIIAAAVVTMIGLGFWQLDRLDARQTENDLKEAQAQIAVTELATLVDVDAATDAQDALEFRKVSVTGEFLVDDEVDIRQRTNGGSPGLWVLTPFRLDDGSAVAVNRGWIPLALGGDHARPEAAPPEGRVTIEGWVSLSQQAAGLQSEDPAEGVLDDLARPNLDRFAQQLDYPLYPVYLTLTSPEPDTGRFPVLIPLGDFNNNGPHFSYAVQWFLFATIGTAGYLLVLRRLARERAGVATPKNRGLIPVAGRDIPARPSAK